MAMTFNIPSQRQLLTVGINAIRRSMKNIKEACHNSPEIAFRTTPLEGKDRNNVTLQVDLVVEGNCQQQLREDLGTERVVSYGEESLDSKLDLSSQTKVVAILDMIDGTDLLRLGFSNWCCAIVFFYPPERKVLASLVGHPSGNIYFACEEAPGAFRIEGKKKLQHARSVPGPRCTTNLSGARVCYYGQKPKNYLSIAENKSFISRLQEMKRQAGDERLDFRLYNLAGNPMMVNMACGGIDAVVELMGQYPHDVVPGAFIAQKAGAALTDLSGLPINMGEALLRPGAKKIKYILSATKELGEDLRSSLT